MMKVLITSGGTREPIDGVRFLSNFSTGRTGAFLADRFSELKWDVTLLSAESAVQPQRAARRESYVTFKDLDREMRGLLERESWDAVVHLAAVSDYSVEGVRVNGRMYPVSTRKKLPSDASEMEIVLKRNFKLIDRIQEYARERIPVVGFKLTRTSDAEERRRAVAGLSARAGVDLVIHNDLGEITEFQHPFSVYSGDRPVAEGKTKEDLAWVLAGLLVELKRTRI